MWLWTGVGGLTVYRLHYFFKREGFSKMSPAGTGSHPSFTKTSSPPVKAECFVRTTIVKLFSFVGIDVIHH